MRSTFYRLSMIAGQGALVVLAGWLQERSASPAAAWSLVFGLLAALFVLAGLYHLWALPRPAQDVPAPRTSRFWADFGAVFAAFFRKPENLTQMT